jgi:hypothetical protein
MMANVRLYPPPNGLPKSLLKSCPNFVYFSIKYSMRYSAILLLMTFVCCSTKNDGPAETPVDPAKTNEEQVLIQYDTTLSFSTKGELDTFKIFVTGKSIREGKCTLQIITQQGEIIYDQSFEAIMLIDFGFSGNANEAEAENHINYRLETFLSPDKFRYPAIAPSATFEKDHSEKETWEEIHADQAAIGFYYLLGKEDKRYIAFSQKRKKVVLYYNCC